MKVCAAVLVLCFLVIVQGVPSVDEVEDAIQTAKVLTAARHHHSLNKRSSDKGGCPFARFHNVRADSHKARARRASDLHEAKKILLNRGFSAADLEHESVRRVFKRETSLDCPRVTRPCNKNEKWRRADGSCNNLDNPTYGMTGALQLRQVDNDYDDNINSPRTLPKNGFLLPHPRLVSNEIHAAKRNEETSDSLTLHVWQFGQFLDHDITLTPFPEIDCCDETLQNEPQCLPIYIEEDDVEPFDAGYCMNFVRSASIARSDCEDDDDDAHTQFNGITSYIDASNVYGSSEEEQAELRQKGSGFLKTSDDGNRLPYAPGDPSCRSEEYDCYKAGDVRANEQPSLAMYHTLFVREHNRIAAMLNDSIRNPEMLFQTTRRIVIATIQNIVYGEFLPAILSQSAMDEYDLTFDEPYVYNDSIDATIDNVFSTAAYRYGHSTIPRDLKLHWNNYKLATAEPLDSNYFDPHMTYSEDPPGLDGLALTLTAEKSPEIDTLIEDSARNGLFKILNPDGTIKSAFDLVALNIQRGREHGLPGLNAYREWCGLDTVDKWGGKGGQKFFDMKIESKLKRLYDHPDDVDAFTGILAEIPVKGGILGPTGECLIGEQFSRIKFGDRFWFENGANGLSQGQIDEIRQYTLAKVLCNNYNFDTVNEWAFISTSPMKSCEDIMDLDINPFK